LQPPKDNPPAAAAEELPPPAGAIRRFGTSRFRTGTVPVAVADGGKTVVTLSHTGTVRRFDAETGRLVGERHLSLPDTTMFLHDRMVRLSADGSVAVMKVFHGGRGHETIAWSTADGLMRWSHFVPRESLVDADLSADGSRLAALIYDGEVNGKTHVRFVDLRGGRRWAIADVGSSGALRLSPDGKRVLLGTGSRGETTKWVGYDADTGRKLWTGPTAGWMLGFSADGSLAFADTGVYPESTVIFDTVTGEPAKGVTPPPGWTYHPWPPTVSPVGSALFVQLSREGRRVLWDYRAGKVLTDLAFNPIGSQERFPLGAFSPDGRFLYTTVTQLQRWDTATGKPTYPETEAEGHTRPVAGVKFTPDGRELISVAMDQRFFRWDAATGRPLSSGRAPPDGTISRVDGHLAIVRVEQRQVIFERLSQPAYVNPEPAKEEVRFDRMPGYTVTAAPTADGRLVLHITDHRQKENRTLEVTVTEVNPVKLRSAVTLPWTVNVPRHPFSPCGRWVVIDGAVRDTATGEVALKPAADIPDGPRNAPLWNLRPVWFSPDGRFMAGSLNDPRPGQPGTEWVAVWELASGRSFRPILLRYEDQLALSPGGRTAVRTGLHGVEVHDLFGGTAVKLPPRDVTAAYAHARHQTVAFTPDGRSFATGHDDGTIVLWAVPGADQPDPAPGDHDTVWAALADADPAVARPAVERLVRHPAAAVALLKARFVPPPEPAPADVPSLIRDLDSETFAVREAASRKLAELGESAGPALREAARTTTSGEVRRRVGVLLGRLTSPWQLPLGGDRLRGVRAVEVLERIGTAEAKAVLAPWRKQTRDPRLAAEAELALARLP
jgi:WD40 repeat protein